MSPNRTKQCCLGIEYIYIYIYCFISCINVVEPKTVFHIWTINIMIVVRGVVFRMLEEPSFLGVSFDNAFHFIKRHLTLNLLLFCLVFCQLVCSLISSDTAVGWYPLEHGVVHSGNFY